MNAPDSPFAFDAAIACDSNVRLIDKVCGALDWISAITD
jgi:hypothetical protein